MSLTIKTNSFAVRDEQGQYHNYDVLEEQDSLQLVHTLRKKITLGTMWAGSDPYTQSVTLGGYDVTADTMVDLETDLVTLQQLEADGVELLYISNNNGALTACATGGRPSAVLTVTAIVYENT